MQINQYVLTYLQRLSDLGFEILFISNSPIKQEYRNLLLERINNCQVFERENSGADFGAWKWAIENNMIPEDTDYLLLTNDSIFGPIFPLASVFDTMQAKPDIDFWGLTDNWEGKWHLQSYFLYFSKKVFTSAAFKKVFKHDFSTLNKLEIIKKGEIQLTNTLLEAGFKAATYVSYKQVVPDFVEWDAKNITHFNWDQLIEEFKFPFVKKELILQNPENIPNPDKIFSVIQKYGYYDPENIKQAISHYLATNDTVTTFPNKISVLCHLYYPGSIYYFIDPAFYVKIASNTVHF